jgi:BASS family bile acid:Na+ symporter
MKSKLPLILTLLFAVFFVIMTVVGMHEYAGWCLVLSFLSLAFVFRSYELLKGYSFTIMIFAAASAAMYYPQYFITVGDFQLKKLITPLMQIIMFGMGTSLSLVDFKRVLQMPKGVFIGVTCHYIIMPLVGFTVTLIFSFPPEVSAGIILIGSCPNGLASNVMTYLAKGNLVLSVTLTAISTMLAPLVTPFLMQTLAGQYVEVDFWKMVEDISKVIILPIAAGLIFNYFLHGKFKILDKVLPVVSMGGITLIIVVIVAAGRDGLLVVGPLLILAMLIHNLTGFFLGYWTGRAFKMTETDSRTIAIEVGLQNGGLGSSLALAMGKLSTVGLASAVFSPLMNITGSTLALWWRAHPPADYIETNAPAPKSH